MLDTFDRLQRWSWHQSHDGATVLLLVPSEMTEEDLSIFLDERNLIVSIKNDTPSIKGCLYAAINVKTSSWQLERPLKNSRTRTTSTSDASSDSSSYAVLTDPDISSSFANSLAGQTDMQTDHEFDMTDESRHHSPMTSDSDDPSENWSGGTGNGDRRRVERLPLPRPPALSRPSSPSLTSSGASFTHPPRLLTIHLDKIRPEIWPALIVTGVPPTVELGSSEMPFASASILSASFAEQRYNMDPTSLVGVGILTLRHDVEAAFEYFCRAWLQDRNPISAVKLATVYMPLHTTPSRSAVIPSERGYGEYVRRIGGNVGLAQLYREVGILYLGGFGAALSTSSPTSISLSLSDIDQTAAGPDPDFAKRYFRRACILDPTVEVPETGDPKVIMPSIEVLHSTLTVKDEKSDLMRSSRTSTRSRKSPTDSWRSDEGEDWSSTYLPSLLGAGLAIGLVGIMSMSWWRTNNR